MIIKQRTTFLDSIMLKVVFPYLEAGNHRSLMRLARIWNGDVTTALRPHSQPRNDTFPLGRYAQRWGQSQRAFGRWLEPQALAPIAIANHRPGRRTDAYERKR